ncbi:thioredoxin-like isoform X1 [Montipora capricornis]|uniref:thioredoxin-like isoform X1 n=1 Tax=Montipora capricornis TaxID=246305 RepID=UPI0035F1B3AC
MAKPTEGVVVHIETKEDFDIFMKEAGSTLVVVDFYADWCGPCKRIKPAIEDLATKHAGKAFFAEVNVDENTETAESEAISAMPTFKLYKDGKKVAELTGANESKLAELITLSL